LEKHLIILVLALTWCRRQKDKRTRKTVKTKGLWGGILLWRALCLLDQEGGWIFKWYFPGRTLTALYFRDIEADALKLHFIGFTHDQFIKHLLCNLIMCGPDSAVISKIALFQFKKYWSIKITFICQNSYFPSRKVFVKLV